MGGDAESTRTDDYVGIRELAPSRNGQRRVRETDGTRLHNVVLSDVHSPAARANYRAFAPRLKLGRRWSRWRPDQLSPHSHLSAQRPGSPDRQGTSTARAKDCCNRGAFYPAMPDVWQSLLTEHLR